MLARWPIRYKLLFGVAMVFLIVAILSFSGFRGVYSYREFVRGISLRAAELPKAATLVHSVDELRFAWRRADDLRIPSNTGNMWQTQDFNNWLVRVKADLRSYSTQLERESDSSDPLIADKQSERKTVEELESSLEHISDLVADPWVADEDRWQEVDEELERVHSLANSLPEHLQNRMLSIRDEVRGQYRTWIVLSWTTTILTGIMLALLARFFYFSVFQPLRVILIGSRQVAGGDFNHRITLDSHDEMAELANAMNDMTSRFQQIRDDLDRQVKQRTKQAIRSEKLASVGFLAAGVAHEINNPLASIAWCAESLESRLDELRDVQPELEEIEELQVLHRYLRTIQDEAFRCKGITDRLLDFSRMGDSERHVTDLRELTETVIDMVKHLGKYRNKKIRFHGSVAVQARINAQELKQVVLNLVTNALDSLEPDGQVDVYLDGDDEWARLRVVDNGCGMAEEVLNHIFEPFFTRRRDGQGTGLGLSITYRIVEEHGGSIEAHSDGLGTGTEFVVTLPLKHARAGNERQLKAA